MRGLCGECRHAREMRNDRGSMFLLCSLAKSDARYAKYPRLPVLRCDGFEERARSGVLFAAEGAEEESGEGDAAGEKSPGGKPVPIDERAGYDGRDDG